MWYGQKNYTDIQGINGKYSIAQIGCLVTANCNLLEKFGKSIDPPSLNRIYRDRGIYVDVDDGVRDDLGWGSVTAYDGQIQVTQVGGAGWPPHNNAIVKFAYTSPKTGQHTTHFCLVADPAAGTIVDSWDGVIRSPGYYGQPVAWATYANVVPQPVVVVATPAEAPKSTAANGQIIKLAKGDTITAIGLRYGFSAQEILDHNGLTWADARTLPVGYELRLPVAQAPAPATSGYTIEVLSSPRPMHTTKDTQKWAFGNVKEWKDFVSNGPVAANTNIDIVAIATVLVSGQAAAYYMDALALGDYRNTGRVANAIGINWADLADGHYEAPVAPPAPVPTPQAPVQEKAPEPVPEPPKAPIVTPQAEAKADELAKPADDTKPNLYKTTYKAWAKPLTFLVIENGYAKEMDGRRSDKTLHKNQTIQIAGSFIKGQTLYARPQGSVTAGLWWGIPMDNLVSEDEVFNTAVPLSEKIAMRYVLSNKEKIVVLLSKLVASLTKIKSSLTK